MTIFSQVNQAVIRFRAMSDDQSERLRTGVTDLFDDDSEPLVHIPTMEKDGEGWHAEVLIEGDLSIAELQTVYDRLVRHVEAGS